MLKKDLNLYYLKTDINPYYLKKPVWEEDDFYSYLIREGEIISRLRKNFPIDNFNCAFDSYQVIAEKLNKQKALLITQQKAFNATLMITPDGDRIATDLTAACMQLITTIDDLIQLKNEYEISLKQIVTFRNQLDSIHDRASKFVINVDSAIMAGDLSKEQTVQLKSSEKNYFSIPLDASHDLFYVYEYEEENETILKELEACIVNAEKDINLYEHKKALHETIQKEKENKAESLNNVKEAVRIGNLILAKFKNPAYPQFISNTEKLRELFHQHTEQMQNLNVSIMKIKTQNIQDCKRGSTKVRDLDNTLNAMKADLAKLKATDTELKGMLQIQKSSGHLFTTIIHLGNQFLSHYNNIDFERLSELENKQIDQLKNFVDSNFASMKLMYETKTTYDKKMPELNTEAIQNITKDVKTVIQEIEALKTSVGLADLATRASLANRLFNPPNKSAANASPVDQSQKPLNPRSASMRN